MNIMKLFARRHKIVEYSVEELRIKKEDQTYDRKSARKDPKGLSNHIVAFANADGGVLVIGIEDNGEITGIDDYTENINEILRVPFDFCKPSVLVEPETIECVDKNGKSNHLLAIKIPQSPELHANQQDDVYYRMGDKSQKLSFDDRLRLMYSKGSRYYEDEPVADSSIEDIDMDFVAIYCKKIGYTKSPEEYIRQNKSFIAIKSGRQEMSGAAILLFGKNPQQYFQRARIRFIRYDGIQAKVGAEMNVVKDKIFTGRILDMVEKTLSFVRDQIKEHTYLGKEGRFVTTPEFPDFVWKEIIINAVTHRDYSIKGTDIQIKMFDDRIVVESPGNLPGIVRLSNIRQVHFSRNPKIAAFLHEYDYVQEFGEGVDRMYREMEKAGLPAPEYNNIAFMLNVTIRNKINVVDNVAESVVDNVADHVIDNASNTTKLSFTEQAILKHLQISPELSAKELAGLLHKTSRTIQRNINSLKEKGFLQREGSDRSGRWIILKRIH